MIFGNPNFSAPASHLNTPQLAESFQTFTYTCTLHAGMFGSITVVAPEPASAAIFAGLTLFWPAARSNRRRSGVAI